MANWLDRLKIDEKNRSGAASSASTATPQKAQTWVDRWREEERERERFERAKNVSSEITQLENDYRALDSDYLNQTNRMTKGYREATSDETETARTELQKRQYELNDRAGELAYFLRENRDLFGGNGADEAADAIGAEGASFAGRFDQYRRAGSQAANFYRSNFESAEQYDAARNFYNQRNDFFNSALKNEVDGNGKIKTPGKFYGATPDSLSFEEKTEYVFSPTSEYTRKVLTDNAKKFKPMRFNDLEERRIADHGDPFPAEGELAGFAAEGDDYARGNASYNIGVVANAIATFYDAGYDDAQIKAVFDSDERFRGYNYYYDDAAKRASGKDLEETAEYAKEHPVAGALMDVAATTANLFYAPAGVLQNAEEGEINRYASQNYNLSVAKANREGLNERFGDVGGFLYDSAMSILQSGESIAAGALTGLPALSLVMMGTSAGASGMVDAKERGLSDGKAALTGIFNGAAEAAFESLSLGNLKSVKRFLAEPAESVGKKIGKALLQSGVEGSEEVLTDFANTISDVLINADQSEFEQSVQKYMDGGKTEKDAINATFGDLLKQAGLSFAGGALSGAVMDGAVSILNAVANDAGKVGQSVIDADLAEAAARFAMDAYAESTSEYQTAQKILDTVQSAKEGGAETTGEITDALKKAGVKPSTLGTLVKKTSSVRQAAQRQSYADALTDARMTEKKAQKIARDVFAGVGISKSELTALADNPDYVAATEKATGVDVTRYDTAKEASAALTDAVAKRSDILDALERYDSFINEEPTPALPTGDASRNAAIDAGGVPVRNIGRFQAPAIPASQGTLPTSEKFIRLSDGVGLTRKDTGATVVATGVASSGGGNLVLRTADGGTVDLADVETDDAFISDALKTASSYGTYGARAYLYGYDGNNEVPVYHDFFDSVYQLGKQGTSYGQFEEAVAPVVQYFGRDMLQSAWASGVNDRIVEIEGEGAVPGAAQTTAARPAQNAQTTAAGTERASETARVSPTGANTARSERTATNDAAQNQGANSQASATQTQSQTQSQTQTQAQTQPPARRGGARVYVAPKAVGGKTSYVKISKGTRAALIAAGVSVRRIKNVDLVAKILNRQVVMYYGESSEDGYQQDGVIYINMHSRAGVEWTTIGHELTHILEKAGLYGELRDFILKSETYKNVLKKNGMTEEQYVESVRERYRNRVDENGRRAPIELTDGEIEREIVAGQARKMLFKDFASVRKLRVYKVKLFNKVRSFIERLTERFTRDDPFKNELIKARGLYRRALIEAEKLEKGGNVAVSRTAADEADAGKRQYSVGSNAAESDGDFVDTTADGETETAAEQTPEQKRLADLIKQYGEIPAGERATVEAHIPRRTDPDSVVGRHIRTILESGALTPEMVSDVEKRIIAGEFSHIPVRDKAAKAFADAEMDKGMESAWAVFESDMNGKTSKKGVALGYEIIMQSIADKDYATALNAVVYLAEAETRGAQVVQAARLLKKMGPAAQLAYVVRAVNRINRAVEEQNAKKTYVAPYDYGDSEKGTVQTKPKRRKVKQEPVKLNSDIAAGFLSAEDEDDRDLFLDALYQDAADQLKVSWVDKWNAWRYFSMLFNPTTHIRNLVGNGLFGGVVRLKDAVAVPLEKAVFAVAGKKYGGRRSKVLRVKSEYREYASRDYYEVADALDDGGGKFGDENKIREKRQIFKTRWIDALRKANLSALENEDTLFIRRHYVHALGSFLQANNVDLSELEENPNSPVLTEARDYAMDQALKATFHDDSAFARKLSDMASLNKLSDMLINGVLPFKKTPINIIKRGVEYSPAGLITTVVKAVKGLNNGQMTLREFVDGLAGGLTGTAIFFLGMWLSSMGILRGSVADDEKEKDFKELRGEQNYSVVVGTLSYTVDWSVPSAMPLLMGAEMMNVIRGEYGEGVNWADVAEVFGNILNPMVETSMLQGVEDALRSFVGPDGKVDIATGLTTAIQSSIMSYVSQGIPTILGKFARVVDPTRRVNGVSDDVPLPREVQRSISKSINKIPGLSYFSEPYVDEWGREERDEDIFGRVFENFFSPGYVSRLDKTDAVNNEIARLYEQTGEGKVLPAKMDDSFKVGGVEYSYSGKEYTDMVKRVGSTSYEGLRALFKDPRYEMLNDAEKAEVVSDIYDFSEALVKQDLVAAYTPQMWMRKAIAASNAGVPTTTVFVFRKLVSGISGDKDENGKTISGSAKAKVLAIIDAMNLEPEQKDALYRYMDYAEEGLAQAPWNSISY